MFSKRNLRESLRHENEMVALTLQLQKVEMEQRDQIAISTRQHTRLDSVISLVGDISVESRHKKLGTLIEELKSEQGARIKELASLVGEISVESRHKQLVTQIEELKSEQGARIKELASLVGEISVESRHGQLVTQIEELKIEQPARLKELASLIEKQKQEQAAHLKQLTSLVGDISRVVSEVLALTQEKLVQEKRNNLSASGLNTRLVARKLNE